MASQAGLTAQVALLAEGVDRNHEALVFVPRKQVALLAEGVDRNGSKQTPLQMRICRPPRGGRG